MYTQQTSGMTALHDLSAAPEIVTSTSSSPSAEPNEDPPDLEQKPPQNEPFSAAPSVSPITTEPPLDTTEAEEPDLPPKSGE